jgi:hypothetical protein
MTDPIFDDIVEQAKGKVKPDSTVEQRKLLLISVVLAEKRIIPEAKLGYIHYIVRVNGDPLPLNQQQDQD